MPKEFATVEQCGTGRVTAAASNDVMNDDYFGLFSNNPEHKAATEAVEENSVQQKENVTDVTETSFGLPTDGKMFEAKIYTRTVGIVFLKPLELTESLYLNAEKSLLDALGDRPVVSFMVEDSGARQAGVKRGHVLIKVNGMEVKNPREASKAIGESDRPIQLKFYAPNLEVTIFEGMHMVKYDEKTKLAPLGPHQWKPKFVVVGGILGKKWQVNMFRSKAEYDIAVMESLDRRPISVKVKQFGMFHGTRIVCDSQGREIKCVRYKGTDYPWYYFVIKPPGSFPIKISASSMENLKPIHEGISRILSSQSAARQMHYEDGKAHRDHTTDKFARSPRIVSDYPH